LAGVDVRDDLQGKWQKYVRKTIASLKNGFYGHFIKRHIIIKNLFLTDFKKRTQTTLLKIHLKPFLNLFFSNTLASFTAKNNIQD
jgi:hypothetical protein